MFIMKILYEKSDKRVDSLTTDILDKISDSVIVLDKDKKILYCNRKFLEEFNSTKKEKIIESLNYQEFIYCNDKKNYKRRIYNIDGKNSTIDVNLIIGKWEEKEIYIFILNKIINRINNYLLRTIDATIWEIDKNGTITLLENKCVPSDCAKVKEGQSIFNSDFSCKCKEATINVLKGIECNYEEHINDRVFNIIYKPVFDEANKVLGAIGIAQDISNLKMLEKQLVDNEARLRLAIECSKIGYWDWNIKKLEVRIEGILINLIQYKGDNVINVKDKIWGELIEEGELIKVKNKINKYLNGIEEFFEYEIKIKTNNGEIVWLLVRGDIIERDENNLPTRMMGTYIDITDRKEILIIEEKLKSKEEENKIKSEFMANISHELRTPINIIYSATQMENNYIDKLNIKEIEKYNEIIKQNSLRLTKIINNIIDMTRLDAGFFKVELKIENIVYLVENIVFSMVSYAESKNISIIFDTEIEDIYIKCDPNLIERIVLNILSNSIKYSKDNGNININIAIKEGNKVLISFKDDGIGIPLEFHDKIFERFQRAERNFQSNIQGSGIGLSLVKSFVEIQNGKIWFKSQVEKGTEFFIEFPLVNENIEEEFKSQDVQFNSMIDKATIELSDICTS